MKQLKERTYWVVFIIGMIATVGTLGACGVIN